MVRLGVSGAHMASNAAAAIAVAGTLGLDLAAAVEALGSARLSAMRMEVVGHPSGATVVNDAYNANPTSMRAALHAVAAMEGHRKIAVLGLMAELDDPVAGHREVAEVADALGIELIAVGTHHYGVVPSDDPLVVVGELRAGDVVLVKASRAAGLERIVQSLLGATSA